MYPNNSREVSFLSTAECRDIFARLVRELDQLDEAGHFGPEGWRRRLAGPRTSGKSMSGLYRDQLAQQELLGDRLIGKPPDFGSGNEGSSPSPSANSRVDTAGLPDCDNCRTHGQGNPATVEIVEHHRRRPLCDECARHREAMIAHYEAKGPLPLDTTASGVVESEAR